MPVTLDLVRVHVLGDRYEVRGLRRLAAGAGDAALAVDDGVTRELAQWPEGEDGGCGIAARRRHERRAPYLVPVGLGEAIDGGVEQLRGLVWLVVRLVALAVQPEV